MIVHAVFLVLFNIMTGLGIWVLFDNFNTMPTITLIVLFVSTALAGAMSLIVAYDLTKEFLRRRRPWHDD